MEDRLWSIVCHVVPADKPGVQDLLSRCHAEFLERLVAPEGRGTWAVIDGMPLTMSDFSKDPDARNGRAYRHWGRGYKLHAVFDISGARCGGRWRKEDGKRKCTMIPSSVLLPRLD